MENYLKIQIFDNDEDDKTLLISNNRSFLANGLARFALESWWARCGGFLLFKFCSRGTALKTPNTQANRRFSYESDPLKTINFEVWD